MHTDLHFYKNSDLNTVLRTTAVSLVLMVFITACGSSSNKNTVEDPIDTPSTPNVPDTPTSDSGSWYQPKPLATWQWQLQGLLTTAYNVDIYDIDLFDNSEVTVHFLQKKSSKVICYFSAGSYENWRSDADQFKASELGKALDGWEGERWLDIRSANVKKIMRARLDLAKKMGCDGVEPDNVDGYSNQSGFPLTAQDQLVFNRFLATEAHQRGLSIGLKNDLDQVKTLVNDFDFAVNEQCFEFSECDLLKPFIDQGKAVFNAEYKQKYINEPNARQSLCKEAKKLKFSTLILPLKLDDSFRYSCL